MPRAYESLNPALYICSKKVARDKTEELSEVIARLRAYERGHYGLEEAVDEANTAKKHNKIKDRQIEELTQEANNLQVKYLQILCFLR